MINLAAINEKTNTNFLRRAAENLYRLPSWEIADTFTISDKKFFFCRKKHRVNLLKNFSERNMLEKYSIRTIEGRTLADMDLRIYKDSIYIISLEMNNNEKSKEALNALIKTALKRAFDGGADKDVFISIMPEQHCRNALIKQLINIGFAPDESQNSCEKRMFGDMYVYSRKNTET